LKTFSTISPVPGFGGWLARQAETSPEIATLMAAFDVYADDEIKNRLEKLAASYLLEHKNARDRPLDPVARFHLRNGAILERINVLGDPSENGMKQSLGMMVNYVYDLSRVEDNHEEYMKNNRIIASSQVRKLLNK